MSKVSKDSLKSSYPSIKNYLIKTASSTSTNSSTSTTVSESASLTTHSTSSTTDTESVDLTTSLSDSTETKISCKNDIGKGMPTDLGTNSPAQPIISFPYSSFSATHRRSFNKEWYKTFPWIEYSVQVDSVFCFPCRKDLNENAAFARDVEETFIKNGFQNWKKALEPGRGFRKHAECASHVKV